MPSTEALLSAILIAFCVFVWWFVVIRPVLDGCRRVFKRK